MPAAAPLWAEAAFDQAKVPLRGQVGSCCVGLCLSKSFLVESCAVKSVTLCSFRISPGALARP